MAKRKLIEAGDIVRCFSGKNLFYSKIIATYSRDLTWGGTEKRYWVEIPVTVDKEKLPSWRDKHEGTHSKFKQYEGKEFKAGTFYVELDATVAKRVTPLELEVFKMKTEIYKVSKDKTLEVKLAKLGVASKKKKIKEKEVDMSCYIVEAPGKHF